MKYDNDFWNKYADNNDSNYNEEFSKFIRDLAFSLKAENVLEVGCSTGNDLRAFPENFDVSGIDLNDHALNKARQKLGSFKFKKGSIIELPCGDSSFDLVFTHKVLNYIDDKDMTNAISELFRVSRKYIVNFELFSDDEEVINTEDKSRYRNMYKRWLDFKVKIISNVDMHEEIDSEKSRFNLIKKL